MLACKRSKKELWIWLEFCILILLNASIERMVKNYTFEEATRMLDNKLEELGVKY